MADYEETISGYAAIFYRHGDKGTEYALGPDMIERIRPGAFRSVLSSGDTTSEINHDPNLLIARQGTEPVSLLLHQDSTGLHTRIYPLDSAAGRDALTLVRSKAVRGMSFGFSLQGGRDEWHREGGTDVRTIHEVGHLFDASPCAWPAYRGTSCKIELAQRSLASRLDVYAMTAAAARRTTTTTKRNSKMFMERSDDRTRGLAPQRNELQKQTRLRLYQRRADLLAEDMRVPANSQRADEIRVELADLDREERQLAVVMETRSR